MEHEKRSACTVIAVAVMLLLFGINCSAQQQSQNQSSDSSQNESQQPDPKTHREKSKLSFDEERADHSCTLSAAGTFVTPEGEDRQNFNHGGWGFQAGGGFRVTHKSEQREGHAWYLTGNYQFAKFRARAAALAAAISQDPALAAAKSAHGEFSAITIDPTFRLRVERHYSLYLGGGFGWLHRGIGFNGANPGPGLLPGGNTLLREASNSGVFDFGVGGNFAPRAFHGVMLFLEARVYHGTAINSGSTLVPISIGVRW
jgi:hypothetical protein